MFNLSSCTHNPAVWVPIRQWRSFDVGRFSGNRSIRIFQVAHLPGILASPKIDFKTSCCGALAESGSEVNHMECSRATVGQLSLDEFVKVVATIYSAHDK